MHVCWEWRVLNRVLSGADVGHPGPGVTSIPSMTGLVASVNPAVSEFTSSAQVQHPRVEIIQDLEQMVFVRVSRLTLRP